MDNLIKEKQNSVSRSQTSTTVCEIWHWLKHKGNSIKQSTIDKHEKKFKKLRVKIPQNNVTHTLEHTVDTSYQEPINLSQTPLNEDEISLMTKGPSFVPLPKNVDWLDTRIALDKFSSKLRWRYMRFKAEKKDPQTSEAPQNSEKTVEEVERTTPWTKNSKLRKPPSPTDNAALESFINCLETTILNPKNLRKVKTIWIKMKEKRWKISRSGTIE